MIRRPVVGLALGGGAARALAHIGVLKVLEANGLAPTVLAGTSFGAVIAALYALGQSAQTLQETVRFPDRRRFWSNVLDPGLSRASLVGGTRYLDWLERRYFHGATFENLRYPLSISCTDTATGELVCLREGSLARAVVASCALPGIIAPVQWRGRWLIDGGLVATVPFAALADSRADTLIGVHAGVRSGRRALASLRAWHASGWGQALYRRLQRVPGQGSWSSFLHGLACVQASYEQRITAPEHALLIQADPRISWFAFHRAEVAVAAGERATRLALAQAGLLTAAGLEWKRSVV